MVRDTCIFVWFNESWSYNVMQRQFRTMCMKNPPQRNTIAAWFKRFIERGCVAHREHGLGRHSVVDYVVERVRRFYERSPWKSAPSAGNCQRALVHNQERSEMRWGCTIAQKWSRWKGHHVRPPHSSNNKLGISPSSCIFFAAAITITRTRLGLWCTLKFQRCSLCHMTGDDVSGVTKEISNVTMVSEVIAARMWPKAIAVTIWSKVTVVTMWWKMWQTSMGQ